MIFIKCVIVTGMSGAGKSTVLKFLEDLGYFCVDNLPQSLIPKFIELCNNQNAKLKKVALGIDIRSGHLFDELINYIFEIKQENFSFDILFLDASNQIIIKRFKESRRNHPLGINTKERLISGIEKERCLLGPVKSKADYIIDTSYLLTKDLKQKINEIFIEDKKFNSLMITIISFGFKYGIPCDSDLVFDVRFLLNPFYIPELKNLTGNDEEVKKYVTNQEEYKIFLNKLENMISFLIPNYIKEGKNQLVISIGCTGGKHRSITLANDLFFYLKELGNNVIINHRDIDKNLKG